MSEHKYPRYFQYSKHEGGKIVRIDEPKALAVFVCTDRRCVAMDEDMCDHLAQDGELTELIDYMHAPDPAAELVAKAREVVEVRARMKAGRSMDIAGLADQFDNAINSLAAALDAFEKGGAE